MGGRGVVGRGRAHTKSRGEKLSFYEKLKEVRCGDAPGGRADARKGGSSHIFMGFEFRRALILRTRASPSGL